MKVRATSKITNPAGDLLRTVRLQQQLTQQELGELANMSQACISNLERGSHSGDIGSCVGTILNVLARRLDDDSTKAAGPSPTPSVRVRPPSPTAIEPTEPRSNVPGPSGSPRLVLLPGRSKHQSADRLWPEDPESYSSGFYCTLNHWSKQTNMWRPYDRSFIGKITHYRRMGWPLSAGQRRYITRLLAEAFDQGFHPAA